MDKYTFENYRGCLISYTPVDHFWDGQRTWSVCFEESLRYFTYWNPVHFPRQSYKVYGKSLDEVRQQAHKEVDRWRDEYGEGE